MRTLLFVFMFIISSPLWSQRLSEPVLLNSEGKNHFIKTEAEAYHSSQDLTNEFTNKFIRGGFIDSTLKKGILDQLKTENHIGAELNYGINYYCRKTQFFGLPAWGWFFGLSNHENYNLGFSKNSFELAFFGNKTFAGKTVELAPLQFNLLRFQKLSAGIFHKETHSRIGIGFIKAEDFISLNMGSAQLYTEASGAELSLSLQENLMRSDSLNKGFFASNGFGMATDLEIFLNAGKNRNVNFKNTFKISLQNFGFIQWNKSTLSQTLDTSYNYTGFEINNLLDGVGSPFANSDLTDTLGINSEQKSHLQFLPFTFTLSKVIDPTSENDLQAYYGVRLRALAQYKPMVFAGLHYRFLTNYFSSLYASFGGYGGFRAGLQVGGEIKNLIQFSINTGDLIGLVSKKGYGRDFGLTLYANF